MVYKTEKGGVRSGNTLRGLHSLRIKRYSRQGCILGRTNLATEEVDELLEDPIDRTREVKRTGPSKSIQKEPESNKYDDLVNDSLLNTDVLLSLNKRQRWNVPAAVINMVQAGRFSSTNTMFSVLERHKLRRRANCVRFSSNKRVGSSSRGQVDTFSGQSKYFSFSLNHIDQEESRRKWKKRKAEEIAKINKENRKNEKNSKGSLFNTKTIVVATVDGSLPSFPGPLISEKQEYRLEVFYPCPKSCSLTYNPKYTDVVMTQNDAGEMEVRSNVRAQKKSQRKHRKRFKITDVAEYDMTSSDVEEDIESMWQEVDGEPVDFVSESNDDNVTLCSSSENVLAGLLDNAEKVKNELARKGGARQRRRSGRHSSNSSDPNDFQQKSHIIHIDNASDFTQPNEVSVDRMMESMHVTENIEQEATLPSASIVLNKDDVNQKNLLQKFAHRYAEADCEPRRFCIDITENVANILSPYRDCAPVAFTTFVVFTHRGIYDRDMDSFDIKLNCAICPDDTKLQLPAQVMSIDSVLNIIVGYLLDLKLSDSLVVSERHELLYKSASEPLNEWLMEKMQIKVDSFLTSQEISRACKDGRLHEIQTLVDEDEKDFEESLLQYAEDANTDIFCEICYESVNPALSDAVPSTQLKSCGHLFCDTCWKSHLRTCMRNGSVSMTCPGFRCKSKLGVATLLSLLRVNEVVELLRREREEDVETDPFAKWCPNPSCGRVLKLTCKSPKTDTDASENSSTLQGATGNDCIGDINDSLAMSVDVVCACGEMWCFNCLSVAHWPASCNQAQDYHDKVDLLTPIKETSDDDTDTVIRKPVTPTALVVEGRFCPRCRRFIQKNGGCPHMQCRCGHQFCWACLQSWSNHSVCTISAKKLYENSRKVQVAHVSRQKTETTSEEKDSTSLRRRQRATMYQRALQHRVDGTSVKAWVKNTEKITTQVCKAAAKDLAFKRQVLHQCGVPETSIPDSSDDLARMPAAKHVSQYLQRCCKSVKYLHHVIEFSYVLLQDCPEMTQRDKQRAMRVTSDLVACSSFLHNILGGSGEVQDAGNTVRKLAELEAWMKAALDALIGTVARIKS